MGQLKINILNVLDAWHGFKQHFSNTIKSYLSESQKRSTTERTQRLSIFQPHLLLLKKSNILKSTKNGHYFSSKQKKLKPSLKNKLTKEVSSHNTVSDGSACKMPICFVKSSSNPCGENYSKITICFAARYHHYPNLCQSLKR